jgi:hypothetical protein
MPFARLPGFRALACLTLAGLAAVGAGCNPTYRTHGASNIVGRYTPDKLTAELPGSISVASAVAAAEEQFRDQGYSILESKSTESEGTVVALAPRMNDYPRATVRITAGDGVTRVAIWKSLINEEALCRGILSRMCAKLGL